MGSINMITYMMIFDSKTMGSNNLMFKLKAYSYKRTYSYKRMESNNLIFKLKANQHIPHHIKP